MEKVVASDLTWLTCNSLRMVKDDSLSDSLRMVKDDSVRFTVKEDSTTGNCAVHPIGPTTVQPQSNCG